MIRGTSFLDAVLPLSKYEWPRLIMRGGMALTFALITPVGEK
jgi:hypothetical protein